MSEWLDIQKQPSSNFRQLLQERIEQSNQCRKLTAEETKRLKKLEGIADKLKRGENVQNRQLQFGFATSCVEIRVVRFTTPTNAK